jgi:hypothetical protein
MDVCTMEIVATSRSDDASLQPAGTIGVQSQFLLRARHSARGVDAG